mgnify:CR=1 FL=1
MEREFVNGEKLKVLRTLSGDKERSEWSKIMHKYLKKCGLGEFLEINLNNGQSKEIKRRKARLFFKMLRKSMVEEYYKRLIISFQSP